MPDGEPKCAAQRPLFHEHSVPVPKGTLTDEEHAQVMAHEEEHTRRKMEKRYVVLPPSNVLAGATPLSGSSVCFMPCDSSPADPLQ